MLVPMIVTTLMTAAPPAAGTAADIPAEVRRTIADTNAAWLQAMKRQDAAAIAAIYGDEAVFVTATGETLKGRAAMEEFERTRFAQTGRVVDGTIEDDGFARTGSYVYEWGHAALTLAGRDGATSHVVGRFLTVWSPDARGRWRIIRNLSLSD